MGKLFRLAIVAVAFVYVTAAPLGRYDTASAYETGRYISLRIIVEENVWEQAGSEALSYYIRALLKEANKILDIERLGIQVELYGIAPKDFLLEKYDYFNYYGAAAVNLLEKHIEKDDSFDLLLAITAKNFVCHNDKKEAVLCEGMARGRIMLLVINPPSANIYSQPGRKEIIAFLHELGHAFGAPHANQGIMCIKCDEPKEFFDDGSKKIILQNRHRLFRPHPDIR